MPFPAFSFCLICDAIRPEVGGKLAILGFYGLTPNVEVGIGNAALPVALSFVAGFPPVADAGRAVYVHFTVITRPDGREVLRTSPSPLNVAPGMPGLVVLGFQIPPPYPLGIYSITISVNGEQKLEASFRIRSASQPELGGLGGIMIAPSGRPN
jgi:hypothetical protein